MGMINGVVTGLVTNVDDPEKRGRIKVRFPWLGEESESDWTRIATMMGGSDRGSFFMPEVDDEVLVAFEHGDSNCPVVVGFLWNGKDKPPSTAVRERILRSKNGHAIRFLDATPANGSMGALVIEDAHGNRITLSNGKIMIKSVTLLEIEAHTISLQGPEGKWRRVVSPSNNPL